MFDRIFANYLLDMGKLSKENFRISCESQEKKRARLGVIAVSEKMMTTEQTKEVNMMQLQCDKKFGDIAIECGYLTKEQVERLLSLQENKFLSFIQAVVDNKFLSMDAIEICLNSFQQDMGFTLMDIESLKCCDIDKVVAVYGYGWDETARGAIGMMLRTLSRLVDYQVSIGKPYKTKELATENICMQESEGSKQYVMAMSGDESVMLNMAVAFAGKEFVTEIEDALDTGCEFINNVNGLYATQLSYQGVDDDMNVPEYMVGKGTLVCDKEFICVPVRICDGEAIISIVCDGSFKIKE